MDIRPKSKKVEPENSQKVESTKKQNKYESGVISTADAKLVLPPAIQAKLSALGQKYGLPFDLSNIGLDGTGAENVRAFRKIVEMAEGDSKLLPEMLKLVKKLMRCEISLAKFHRGCVTASVMHQEKLDKVTSDIFLKMAGYQANSAKRDLRTNQRVALKEKRTQAYEEYYNQSVFGQESQLIDVEYEVLASNRKILSEGKTEKMELDSARKQRISEYVQSAYRD